jgi:hypothetical protein
LHLVQVPVAVIYGVDFIIDFLLRRISFGDDFPRVDGLVPILRYYRGSDVWGGV